MIFRKIVSIVLVLIGAVMTGGSYYIKDQVAKGKIQLSDAEVKVKKGKTLFSLTPISKLLGDQIIKSADRKIAEAGDEIAYYSKLAQNLLIAGIVLIVVGLSLYIFYARRK